MSVTFLKKKHGYNVENVHVGPIIYSFFNTPRDSFVRRFVNEMYVASFNNVKSDMHNLLVISVCNMV